MNTLVKVLSTPIKIQNSFNRNVILNTILNLNPEPRVLNTGKYLLLGNFPLPWNYFCSKIDEIPKPIHEATMSS